MKPFAFLFVFLSTAVLSSPVRAGTGPELAGLDRVIASPGCEVLFPREETMPREWIVERCRLAIAAVRTRIPTEIPSSLTVRVAPTDSLFRAWTGGRLPEWGVGAALPAKRSVVIRFTGKEREREELDRVLRHEVAHVMLAQACADERVPRWFDEGVAMAASESVTTSHVWILARGVIGGSIVPLVKLNSGFPESEPLARLAYAEGRDAIRFIEERWGEEALRWIFRDMAAGSDFRTAIRRNTGFSPVIFGLAWERDAKERYGALGLLHDSAALWGVVAVAVVIGGVVRRRRVIIHARGEALDAGGEGPAHWAPASTSVPDDEIGDSVTEG